MDHDRPVVEVDRRERAAIWDWETISRSRSPHIGPIDGKEYVDKRGVNGNARDRRRQIYPGDSKLALIGATLSATQHSLTLTDTTDRDRLSLPPT